MASPLSPSSRKIHDVFLSYYGRGTLNNFVDDILHALGRKGTSTRMVDLSIIGSGFVSLQQPIFESMEQSSMVVIVFCKSYVTTPTCLDELVKIMEFSKSVKGGLKVLPVFYGIDPLELRNSDWPFQEIQRNSLRFPNIYSEYPNENVKLWRQAVAELTNIHGLQLKFKNRPNW